MTVVDQYIFVHQDQLSTAELADKLGLPFDLVRHKRDRLNKAEIKPPKNISIHDEIHALVQFIIEREEGIWVEIAKRRVFELNKAANRS